MAYENTASMVKKPHSLFLEDRKSLSLRGVERVDSFHEEEIVLMTRGGLLVIRGTGLHVEALDLENGDSRVSGEISELRYEAAKPQGGFFSRLFG